MKNTTPLFFFILLLFFTEAEAQEFQSAEVSISDYIQGTLIQPQEPTQKLAILIAGSGPTDRNGNSQLSRNNSLKLLAEGLVDEGIAVYRYDKRVVTMMKKRMGKIADLRFEDLISDAAAIVAHFRDQGTFSNIYIIGHSQGSLVGMAASQEQEINGFVSLAGPSQSIDQAIIEQVSAQMPSFEQELRTNFETLKTTGSLNNFNPLLASVFNKDTQPYMLSWMKYDPSEKIKEVTAPVLIINGTRDFQVNELEAKRLAEANPGAKIAIIENMNHVLRLIETEDLLVNQKSYQEPNTPIAQEVVTVIADFLKKID